MQVYFITNTFEIGYIRFNICVKTFVATHFPIYLKFYVFILYFTVIMFSDNNVNVLYSCLINTTLPFSLFSYNTTLQGFWSSAPNHSRLFYHWWAASKFSVLASLNHLLLHIPIYSLVVPLSPFGICFGYLQNLPVEFIAFIFTRLSH